MLKGSDYTFVSVLGEGTYGFVVESRDKTGKRVAVKRLKNLYLEDDDIDLLIETWSDVPDYMLRERKALFRLGNRCPQIIRNYTNFIFRNRVHMVFELMGCDLKEYLKCANNREVNIPKMRMFMKQLAEAVAYCHSKGVVHCDIKPGNILLKGDVLKLTDFGSWHGEDEIENMDNIVTLQYRAPEILFSKPKCGAPIDVWSMGCVLGEMVENKGIIFAGDSEIDQILKIAQLLGTPTEEVCPGITKYPKFSKVFPKWKSDPSKFEKRFGASGNEGLDLLRKMWCYDTEKRITSEDIYKHPFLDF